MMLGDHNRYDGRRGRSGGWGFSPCFALPFVVVWCLAYYWCVVWRCWVCRAFVLILLCRVASTCNDFELPAIFHFLTSRRQQQKQKEQQTWQRTSRWTPPIHSIISSSTMTSSPTTTEELASFANTLADEARKIILPYWRQPIEVESKIEHDRPIAESPVTIADQRAEIAIRKLIEERYPEHGIYGEEFGQVRTDAEYVW